MLPLLRLLQVRHLQACVRDYPLHSSVGRLEPARSGHASLSHALPLCVLRLSLSICSTLCAVRISCSRQHSRRYAHYVAHD